MCRGRLVVNALDAQSTHMSLSEQLHLYSWSWYRAHQSLHSFEAVCYWEVSHSTHDWSRKRALKWWFSELFVLDPCIVRPPFVNPPTKCCNLNFLKLFISYLWTEVTISFYLFKYVGLRVGKFLTVSDSLWRRHVRHRFMTKNCQPWLDCWYTLFLICLYPCSILVALYPDHL